MLQVRLDSCAGEVIVTRRSGEAPNAGLVYALAKIGLRAKVLPIEEATLRVCDLERPECRQRLRRTLTRLRGVRQVEVKGTTCAAVTYDGRHVGPPDLVRVLERAGFKAELVA